MLSLGFASSRAANKRTPFQPVHPLHDGVGDAGDGGDGVQLLLQPSPANIAALLVAVQQSAVSLIAAMSARPLAWLAERS